MRRVALLAISVTLSGCELAFPVFIDTSAGGSGGLGGSGTGGSAGTGGGSSTGGSGGGGSASCAAMCIDAGLLSDCLNGETTCALGCLPDAGQGVARCTLVDPAGVTQPSNYTDATADIVWEGDGGTVFVDSVTGGIKRGIETVRRPYDPMSSILFDSIAQEPDTRLHSFPSPDVSFFGFHSLHIGSGVTVQITGPNAVALLVERELIVDGTITVRGTCSTGTPGSGGSVPGAGACAGNDGVHRTCTKSNGMTYDCSSGGSGAGYLTQGGQGANGNGPGPAGGCAFPSFDPSVFALIGGSGGGLSASGMGRGAGGGALQIVAESVTINGVLDACGCGSGYSGGGGAGGMIVVEGAGVTISSAAILAANGGSGGNVDGTLSAYPAGGGTGVGQGGALKGYPGSPGGASAGRIVLDALDGGVSIADGGIVSPAPIFGSVTGR